jgi:hypothetical protein
MFANETKRARFVELTKLKKFVNDVTFGSEENECKTEAMYLYHYNKYKGLTIY